MDDDLGGCPARPGELPGLVIKAMTAAGLDVAALEPGEGDRLDIACARARCTLAVADGGLATLEYCPWPPGGADPVLAADLATTLLTGRPGPHPWLSATCAGIGFRGLVGRELKARGLDTALAVFTDDEYFDAYAEVVATAPQPGGQARVRVADDGSLTWTRSPRAGTGTAAPGPERCGRAADLAAASAVAATVSLAMSCLLPGNQG